MDYDAGIVAALLRDGEPAYKQLLDSGVAPSWVYAPWQQAFTFVLNFRKQHGVLPSQQAVEQVVPNAKFNGVVSDPFIFFVDEVKKRHIYNIVNDGVKAQALKLDKLDPMGALQELDNVLLRVRKEKVIASTVVPLDDMVDLILKEYDERKAGKMGVPSAWKSIDDMTGGLSPDDLAVWVAPTGMGKCLDEATEITDPVTGVPRTIRQVYEQSDVQTVLTWSPEKGIHAAPITAKVDTGRKECLRFTLATGRSVVVTPEHPFLTPDGWKRADELREGFTVAVPSRVPFPTSPVHLLDAELDILAVLMAEGSTSGNHVGFSSADPTITRLMEEAANAVGADVKYRSGVDYDFVGRRWHSNPVLDLVRKHGLSGKRAVEKIVPDAVWRLRPAQLSRFLSLFWMCDGYVDRGGPGVTLGSEKLVRGIQSLLLRFGIQSSVGYKRATCKGKDFDSWRLRVYSHSLGAFAESVLLWGSKAVRVRALMPLARNPNVGSPRVSEEQIAAIKCLAGEQQGRWTTSERTRSKAAVAEKLGRRNFSPIDLFKPHGDLYSVSLSGLRTYCEEFGGSSKFGWLWNSDLFWDEIQEIQRVGERKIYDLTVAPSSCFVANDILVHNTWTMILNARAAMKAGCKVLFVSTEMSMLRIAMRYVAVELNLPFQDLRKGQLAGFSEIRMRADLPLLKGKLANFLLVGGNFNIDMRVIEAAVEESKPTIIFVDGAYLVRNRGENRFDMLANTVNDMKNMAVSRQIPIVISTQFNRQQKHKAAEASLENVALAYALTWDADWVFALVQTKDMKLGRRMKIATLKGRDAEPISLEINWDLQNQDFSEIAALTSSGLKPGQSQTAPAAAGSPPPEVDTDFNEIPL